MRMWFTWGASMLIVVSLLVSCGSSGGGGGKSDPTLKWDEGKWDEKEWGIKSTEQSSSWA